MQLFPCPLHTGFLQAKEAHFPQDCGTQCRFPHLPGIGEVYLAAEDLVPGCIFKGIGIRERIEVRQALDFLLGKPLQAGKFLQLRFDVKLRGDLRLPVQTGLQELAFFRCAENPQDQIPFPHWLDRVQAPDKPGQCFFCLFPVLGSNLEPLTQCCNNRFLWLALDQLFHRHKKHLHAVIVDHRIPPDLTVRRMPIPLQSYKSLKYLIKLREIQQT